MALVEGKTKALLALWAAVLLWSSSFIALKFAFQKFDPMVVIFGRMFVASLGFMLVFKTLRHIDYRPGDWKLLAFMGICEPGFYFIFEALSLSYTDASQAGMICALLPLMVAVAARLTLNEPLTKRTVAGFGLAIVGAVVLSAVAESTETASNPVLGNFLEFLAMICACGYMIAFKKLSPRYNPWFLTMIQAFIGAVFYFPLLFLPSTTLPTTIDLAGLATIFYLGIFVTIFAYGMYNYGMSKISAGQASSFINLIPVITLIMGMVILGERLNWMQYAASALVIAGVFISQDRAPRKRQPA
ncbi:MULTISPECIES: DMT family transporter [unclassified Pseudodesulfovibrio]|uniref:DMT family transporter n=1 Tax=unclassified Pseudodesulfovibrio TaxID=2661612 RepID=UPI000FEBEFCA|nr:MULTISPECIES: DMT family transporter [unclassified Pseudodesulfovibrio]MCJ2163088.1 DMT family transporter [Pseudodesulfovibrio sp. S3-i]RWU07081.1 DMT family transporter [Pseudodesulfovibrio sp. S3]